MKKSALQKAAAAPTSVPRTIGRLALGSVLVFAGVSHLSFARKDFTAQVPKSLPFDEDVVVLASGIAEISLGAALVTHRRRRVPVGWIAAAFFTAIFPGNISQLINHRDAFGLDTDRRRAVRLVFQPVLVAVSLWTTGAWRDRRALR
ncbi:DoxX family protein [Frigoribacterium sp. 2-23]|uniref:DoxX family protein n=1 Tax=Frigoribacterium sp. 2-23 TaxID=3415006 RepID=UPI003C6FE2CB